MKAQIEMMFLRYIVVIVPASKYIYQENKNLSIFKIAMTLQQLQYIVALDDHRHFVRAAESCFVAQPTLTLQIRKLEDEVGISIFDRSAHPIKPTPMGEQFLLKAREILRETTSLKAMVNTEKELVAGQYTLGVIPTLAPYLLPRFIKKFCVLHPEVHLEVREMQSTEMIKALKSNMLDIGIMATPLDESALREIPLFYEPFLVYAAADHPLLHKQEIEPRDITEEGLWLLNEGHCFRNQVLNICNQTGDMPAQTGLTFESGSIETIKNMVRGDMGYSLIPELSVNETIDRDFVRRFKEPQVTREISIVVHHSFTKQKLLSRFRRVIIDNIPDSFKQNYQNITVKWR